MIYFALDSNATTATPYDLYESMASSAWNYYENAVEVMEALPATKIKPHQEPRINHPRFRQFVSRSGQIARQVARRR